MKKQKYLLKIGAVLFALVIFLGAPFGALPAAEANDTATITLTYRTDPANPSSATTITDTATIGDYYVLPTNIPGFLPFSPYDQNGVVGWEYDGAIIVPYALNWITSTLAPMKFRVEGDAALELRYRSEFSTNVWRDIEVRVNASYADNANRGGWVNYEASGNPILWAISFPAGEMFYLPQEDVFTDLLGGLYYTVNGANRTNDGEVVLGWYGANNFVYDPNTFVPDPALENETGGKVLASDNWSVLMQFTAVIGVTHTVSFALADPAVGGFQGQTAPQATTVSGGAVWGTEITVPTPIDVAGKYYIWTQSSSPATTGISESDPNNVAATQTIQSDVSFLLTYYDQASLALVANSETVEYNAAAQSVAGYSLSAADSAKLAAAGHHLYYDGELYSETAGNEPTLPSLAKTDVDDPAANSDYELTLDLAKAKIYDAASPQTANDVTSRYALSATNGGLTITPAPVVLRVSSDWAWHTGQQITVELDVNDHNSALLSDHTHSPEKVSASGLAPQTYAVHPDSSVFSIVDGAGGDVSANYDIQVHPGQLEIRHVENNTTPSGGGALSTGDTIRLYQWAVFAIVATVGGIGSILIRKQKKNEA